METAELVAAEVGVPAGSITEVPDLRERYFGTALELQSHDLYKTVWEVDEKNVSIGPAGGGVGASRPAHTTLPLRTAMRHLHAGPTHQMCVTTWYFYRKASRQSRSGSPK